MQLCTDSLPASHPCCHEILHMLSQVNGAYNAVEFLYAGYF